MSGEHNEARGSAPRARRKRVAVLGAGVAGLTAAHELLERGFDVSIFEKRALKEWGGRARSYTLRPHSPDSGRPIDKHVPAEHGFRFFPGFYRHIYDTLARIPFDDSRSVLSNLVPIQEELLAVSGKPRIVLPASAPRGTHLVKAIRSYLQAPQDLLTAGLTNDDLETFTSKLWRFASSCQERRNEEYEGIDWRTFVESLDRSEEYYWYLASGLTRTLVAAKARSASTKTMGNVGLQILLCLTERDNTTDRVLNGPTSDVWIQPWMRYLEKCADARGLDLKLMSGTVKELLVKGKRVTGLRLEEDQEERSFDHVVCALPLEGVVELLRSSPEAASHCSKTKENLKALEKNLTRMSGMQIYFRQDVPICRGHQISLDSPWGLTSISQRQFWTAEHQAKLTEQGIGGVLSVDISSWDLPGIDHPSAAKTKPPVEIFKEVLKQLRSTLGPNGLEDDNLVGWCLEERAEPILVNAVGTWALRPTARCGELESFVLAGDYVRTKTDLACMESANESARVAVNVILEADGFAVADRCALFDPADREPAWLKFFQQMDRRRFLGGLPWGGIDLSQAAVVAARGLDAAGDNLLADDLAATTEGPAPPGTPIRLPRELWDPSAGATQAVTGPAARVQLAVDRARPITDQEAEAWLSVAQPSPGRTDPMFKRWRLYALREDEQDYLIPFHVYEGDSLIVHGRAALDSLRALTKDTAYQPVVGRDDGKEFGFAELWIVDYRDTSAGAYKELVLNFVVTPRQNHRPYRYLSPYSMVVPMMDPQNRLFTPLLLVDQPENVEKVENGGAILYGNRLFGTNKRQAHITIDRDTVTGQKRYGWNGVDDETDQGAGSLMEVGSAAQDVADYLQLARVMGFADVVRNARQAMNGQELQGGLLTRDMRPGAKGTVDIRAAYKYAPKIRLLRDAERKIQTSAPNPKEVTDNLAALLSLIDFSPEIATYDHQLKSVLYLDGWPTPDGQSLPVARSPNAQPQPKPTQPTVALPGQRRRRGPRVPTREL
jgi:15-cis-phytoene desaturase